MPTDAARRARDEIAQSEGINAETTYTAKCIAALAEMAQRPPYRGARLLYWHTYSSALTEEQLTPLPAYRDLPLPFHEIFHGPAIAD